MRSMDETAHVRMSIIVVNELVLDETDRKCVKCQRLELGFVLGENCEQAVGHQRRSILVSRCSQTALFYCIPTFLAFLFPSNVDLRLVPVQSCGHFGLPSVRVADAEGRTINSDRRRSRT